MIASKFSALPPERAAQNAQKLIAALEREGYWIAPVDLLDAMAHRAADREGYALTGLARSSMVPYLKRYWAEFRAAWEQLGNVGGPEATG